MTSVINDLSMSEVRRCLQEIRKSWDNQTPWVPFCPSTLLHSAGEPQISMTKFAWLFVSGHHVQRKRQRVDKRLSKATTPPAGAQDACAP